MWPINLTPKGVSSHSEQHAIWIISLIIVFDLASRHQRVYQQAARVPGGIVLPCSRLLSREEQEPSWLLCQTCRCCVSLAQVLRPSTFNSCSFEQASGSSLSYLLCSHILPFPLTPLFRKASVIKKILAPREAKEIRKHNRAIPPQTAQPCSPVSTASSTSAPLADLSVGVTNSGGNHYS